VELKIVSYADDTQLLFLGHLGDLDVMKQFATEVNEELMEWFLSMGLKNNVSKTQCMVIASPYQHSHQIKKEDKNIVLNKVRLEFVSSVTNLGIKMDECFTFKDQCNSIYSKTFNSLLNIKKI